MKYTEFILNGKICDAMDIKDGYIEVFNRKWYVVNNDDFIVFYYLSEKDIKSLNLLTMQ